MADFNPLAADLLKIIPLEGIAVASLTSMTNHNADEIRVGLSLLTEYGLVSEHDGIVSATPFAAKAKAMFEPV
jgi:hypothetical protein